MRLVRRPTAVDRMVKQVYHSANQNVTSVSSAHACRSSVSRHLRSSIGFRAGVAHVRIGMGKAWRGDAGGKVRHSNGHTCFQVGAHGAPHSTRTAARLFTATGPGCKCIAGHGWVQQRQHGAAANMGATAAAQAHVAERPKAMSVASTATMPHMLAATIAKVWICDRGAAAGTACSSVGWPAASKHAQPRLTASAPAPSIGR